MEDQEFVSRLGNEVKAWKNAKIITDAQAGKILSRYGTPEKRETVMSMSRILTVIAFLGAILFGCGVITLIASNWSAMPDFLKVIVVLFLNFAVYGAGYYLKFMKKSHPRVGTALIFLGSLMIGASIFIISQTYNVAANSPWLLLLWFLMIAPATYLFGMNSILGLSIVVFSIWLNIQSADLLTLSGDMVLLFIMNLTYGIFLYSLGGVYEIFEPMKRFASPCRFSGALFILTVTLLLTTVPLTQMLDRHLENDTWFLVAIFIFAAITILASIATFFLNKSREMHFRIIETAGAILLLIFAFFYAWGPIDMSLAYYLLFNFIMLAEIIGFAYIGLKTRKSSILNLSMVFFAFLVLIRYFDFAWDFMDKSCFMLIAGALLLGGGYLLEKKRNELLKQMEAQSGG